MKNLKRTALAATALIALLCVSGCGVVNEDDIKKATKICEPNGGIKAITVRNIEVECKNGATFTWVAE